MKKVAALFALALASVALVACGSSNSTTTTSTSSGSEKPASGGSSTLEVETDPGGQLAYTTTEASAKAGKVTVDFKNSQGLTHDVAIEDSSGKTVGQTELIAESKTSTSVNLKPGTYHYFCTVPGHREAGMEGTLVVK
jgi:plastocyanin